MNDSIDPLLADASAEVLSHVRAKVFGAPEKVAAMLTYIATHLFENDLSIAGIRKACGIRDNSVAVDFHSYVGEPPGAFIGRCRLEVAQHLLRSTTWPIWEISRRIGYGSIQVFSRAFLKRTGRRPSAWRRAAWRPAETLPTATGRTDKLDIALAGQLEDAEAAQLIRRLLTIYPPRAVRKTA